MNKTELFVEEPDYKPSDEPKTCIRDWPVDERPREKLLTHGVNVLSNAELLAIVLGSGTRQESAVDLAKRILNMAKNNLNELRKTSIDGMCRQFKGIGPARAATIAATLEIGKRLKYSDTIQRIQIRNSKDIFELFHPHLSDLDHEECWLLLMNNQHRILDTVRISRGGVSGTTVDPKIILKSALEKLASSIVLCHNHPSGNPYPSTCDDRITQKLKNACANLDIQFTDHLVFCESSYYSYADEGKL